MALHNTKLTSQLLLAFFVSICFYQSASAAEGSGATFGVLYGLAVPDAENVNPSYLFGLKGSAILSPALSVGGYFLNSSTKNIGSGGKEFTYSNQGLEAGYHIPGSSGETTIGARVGISKVRTKEAGENILFSPYHWGVVCAYDYLVASWASIGFEGSFIYVDKDKTTSSTGTHNLDSFSVLSFMVSLQFRL